MTKIAGSVSIQLNTAELKLGGRRYARAVVTELAKAVQTQAKHNVAPGVGPGPHPHKEWPGWPENVDTGDLMRSVEMEVIRDTEELAEAAVYTDKGYGADLELGWQSWKGNAFRYPFCGPRGSWPYGSLTTLLSDCIMYSQASWDSALLLPTPATLAH